MQEDIDSEVGLKKDTVIVKPKSFNSKREGGYIVLSQTLYDSIEGIEIRKSSKAFYVLDKHGEREEINRINVKGFKWQVPAEKLENYINTCSFTLKKTEQNNFSLEVLLPLYGGTPEDYKRGYESGLGGAHLLSRNAHHEDFIKGYDEGLKKRSYNKGYEVSYKYGTVVDETSIQDENFLRGYHEGRKQRNSDEYHKGFKIGYTLSDPRENSEVLRKLKTVNEEERRHFERGLTEGVKAKGIDKVIGIGLDVAITGINFGFQANTNGIVKSLVNTGITYGGSYVGGKIGEEVGSYIGSKVGETEAEREKNKELGKQYGKMVGKIGGGVATGYATKKISDKYFPNTNNPEIQVENSDLQDVNLLEDQKIDFSCENVSDFK